MSDQWNGELLWSIPEAARAPPGSEQDRVACGRARGLLLTQPIHRGFKQKRFAVRPCLIFLAAKARNYWHQLATNAQRVTAGKTI